MLNALTPILSISSALFFLLAAGALLKWKVPRLWFPWLIVAGCVVSIVLQVIWFSGWIVFPLLVDIGLLWAVFSLRISVDRLRG